MLGGQLVAAKLNVAIAWQAQPNPNLTVDQLRYLPGGCVNPLLNGMTVAQVIALADQAVAGNGLPAGLTFADLTTALDVLNRGFDDCTTNLGCLGE